MDRSVLVIAILLGCGLVVGMPVSARTEAVVARSLDHAPESRREGNQALDAAIAASLIGAISGQFDERTVEIKLDRVDLAPAGIIQRDVSGRGRLMLGNDNTWIPFRFSALYDTGQESVGFPNLTIGEDAPGQVVTIGSPVASRLRIEVDRRLHQEFSGQPAAFSLDAVRLLPAGNHYARLEASGIVDFGKEGATPVGVQALYDKRNGHWLRVNYELGATANRQPETVALR